MSAPTTKRSGDVHPVEKPIHYNAHPSGVECIEIAEWLPFNLGNALKYLWRSDLKNGAQDREKAAWYLRREIARIEAEMQRGEQWEPDFVTLDISILADRVSETTTGPFLELLRCIHGNWFCEVSALRHVLSTFDPETEATL